MSIKKINVICTHIETGIISQATLTLFDDWFVGEFDIPVIRGLDVKFWFGELSEKHSTNNVISGLRFNIDS